MKNKSFFTLSSLGMVILLSACFNKSSTGALKYAKELRNPEGKDHYYSQSQVKDEEYLAFKDKIRAFSSRLCESFAKQNFDNKKNIVLSPLSIELSLGLAISAANGNTRQEMLDAIGVDYQTFAKYYALFYNQMSFKTYSNTKDDVGELTMSNSIWIDGDVTLKDSGLDDLNDNYYCYSYHVDFDGNNKKSNEAMREFVKKQTKGLIDQNLNISPETLFVLMNTLYLKDVWNEGGTNLSYASKDFKFTNYDGTVSDKQLLQGYYVDGRTLETEDYYAFHSITESNINIHFVLPKDGHDLKDVFNKDTMNYVLDDSHYKKRDLEKREIYHTRCLFPSYEASIDLDLKPILINDFDIKSLFNETCDFSNLSNDEVYCSEFKHIAKLKVNKKGIEGAAVTYQAYSGAAAPDETWKDVYEQLVIDKAFGFIVTYANNDVIFSGIITNID